MPPFLQELPDLTPFPVGLTAEQMAGIEELARASIHLVADDIRDKLRSVAEQRKSDCTTIRISTHFPHGQIEPDQFLGPFPRLIPSINVEVEETSREIAELLRKGEVTVRVTKDFGLHLPTLKQKIIEGYAGGVTWSFLPDETAGTEVRTACQVTFHPIEDKLWFREQVLHYQIRDVSAMRSFFRDAQRLLDDDQAEDAVQKLSEGLKTFPEDALIAGLLGWAHYKAGDLDSAHKYGRKAVDLEVRSDWSVAVPFAFYNLGLCSLLLGRFERSMTWYEMSVDRYKGLVLDESIEDLEEVLSADRPEAWFALGFLREHKEDVPRAIAAYEQFLDSDSPYDKYKQLAQEAIQRLQRSDGEGDKRS